jgi:mono/diheme cytochrome c family protein
MLRLTILLLALAVATSFPVMAADGTQILQSQCAACHALKKPDKADVDRLWERKGPDLYYAGNKFQHDWLVTWLQAPKRIRPGGEFYRKHIKPTPEGDVIDSATLKDHLKLSKEDAESVATALMAMTVPGLVEAGAFKGGEVSATMGAMFFGKLRGCSACHQNAVGKGGFSGPELYTASKRLQADFVYSYIKHPQSIDPHVWMPELGLAEPDLQRLTGYVMQLKEGDAP